MRACFANHFLRCRKQIFALRRAILISPSKFYTAVVHARLRKTSLNVHRLLQGFSATGFFQNICHRRRVAKTKTTLPEALASTQTYGNPSAHQLTRAQKSSALSAAISETPLDLALSPDLIRPVFTRPASLPFWPRRMNAAMAAAYCGEASTRAFLARVGPTKEFPLPRVREGRRVLWLKDDLDKVMEPRGGESEKDIAGDL